METDDYLPIYALAEWHYCPRSAFLSWFGAERRDEVTPAYQKMREVHAVSDEPNRRDKAGRKVETAVRLIHHGLRIVGKADAVEWENGQPKPVEYKNCSQPVPRHLAAQVVLQALCLEEMHRVKVLEGTIFRVAERRRIPIPLDAATRDRVRGGVAAFRASLARGLTGFICERQPGCPACIYRAHCWPEEFQP